MASRIAYPLSIVPVLACFAIAQAQHAAPIRWAAVGNSITQFSGYPDKLQALLGPAYKVENEGVSGTTLLKKGNSPYWVNGRFPQTFAFKPDIVSVKLGTNDSKPVNWPSHKGEFLADARSMLDTLAAMPSKPKLLPCTPVPAFQHNGGWTVDGINDPVIKDEIIPFIKQAATERKLAVVDLHTFLENRADLFANDGVHPDAGKPGADSIAAMLFRSYKAGVTRIACIGNSITDHNHDSDSYPIQFNRLLGRDHYVLNAGYSGSSLIRSGPLPYNKGAWFKEVFRFLPNVITLKLGTNDSQPGIWDAHKDEYVPDLRWMIDTLASMPSHPRIYLCTPIPAWKNADGTESYGIRGAVIQNEIIPRIRQVAKEKGLAVLDLWTPYQPYQKLTPDGVHPNPEGLDTLAHILYRAYQAAQAVALRPPVPRRTPSLAPEANPLAPYGRDAIGRRARFREESRP